MFVHSGIVLRPVERGDLENIRKLRNDPSTWEQLTSIAHISPDQQAAWFAGLQNDQTRAYLAVLEEQRDDDGIASWAGDFVGIVRLTDIDLVNRSVCVGADVVSRMRGQGYGTRIYKALLKYLFDYMNFRRLWLLVLDTNAIGKRLYANAGFTVEGAMRQAIFRDGKYVDYLLMSVLEDEYRGQAGGHL